MALPELNEFARRRDKLKLTQIELAKLVGISQSLMTKCEREYDFIKYKHVKKIDERLTMLENKGKKLARDIMIKSVVSLSSKDTLKKAIDIMKKNCFSQLPIIDNRGISKKEKIVGCITESRALEVIETYGHQEASNKRLLDVMENSLPCVNFTETLSSLRQHLKMRPAVLVMENNKLQGIISKTDVLED